MNRIGGDAWCYVRDRLIGRFRDFIQSKSDEVAAMMTARATQTSEATRRAAVLPLLANLDTEIALLDPRGRDQQRIATSPRLAAQQAGATEPAAHRLFDVVRTLA